MVDIPGFDKDDETAVESAEGHARNLIPWLPDPKTCDCGALCEADTQYVEEMAMPMDVWDCPSCEKRYYRDEDDDLLG